MKMHIFIVAIFAIGVCFSQEKKTILAKKVKKTNLTQNTPGTMEANYWLWAIDHNEKEANPTLNSFADTGLKITFDTRHQIILYNDDSMYPKLNFLYQNILLKYEQGYNSLLIYNSKNKKTENYLLTKNNDTVTVLPVNLKINDGIPSQLRFFTIDDIFVFEEIYNKNRGLYYTKGEYPEIKKNLLDFLIKLEDAYKAERE